MMPCFLMSLHVYKCIIFLGLCISLAKVNGFFSSASFFGNSFTFERVTDFSSESAVSIQFQTHSANGVILIAAGQQDYLIVSMKSGLLQVRMNIGGGETVLKSPGKVKYNNLLWHQIVVLRAGGRLDLQVNGEDVASESVWTSQEDDSLDINLGVFLGGFELSVGAAYLDKSLPFFRGCLLSATFNGIDVLNPLHNLPNHKMTYNIQPGCATIFSASRNEPVTFESTNAYLKYARWTGNNEGTFECHLKTTASDGLILFNTGWKREVFVGLEMVGGTIRASMNIGAGVVGLQSTQFVNNGKWHKIRFSFSPVLLEIRVGKNKTKVYLEQTDLQSETKLLDDFNEIHLKGPLFVGGVDAKTKRKRSSISSGLDFNSFPGCLKSIRVNYKPKSFGDVLTSYDVSTGCRTNQQFSPQRAIPHAPSLPTFVIIPEKPSRSSNKTHSNSGQSRNPLSKIEKKLKQKVCYNLIRHNFTLPEGGSRNVTTDVIQLKKIATKSRHHLSNDNSLSVFNFVLTALPKHGHLSLGRSMLSLNQSVSMKRVFEDNLVYVHNGSETNNDRFFFAIKLLGKDNPIRKKDAKMYHICDDTLNVISDRTAYSINVTINPINDPPRFVIPRSYVFRPIANARTPLPKNIFTANDDDNSASEIVFHALGIENGLYFENSESVGRPVTSFTQDDVNRGKINFVHAGGAKTARLLLQVSNVNESNYNIRSTSVLRVATRPLQISVVNNTGITLVEGEAMVLTQDHISIDTNAHGSLVDVLYRIQGSPEHGQLQMLMGSAESQKAWITVTSFHQSDINKGIIRYLNLDANSQVGSLISDRFTFRVEECGRTVGPFTFNITVLPVKVSVKVFPINLESGGDNLELSTGFIDLQYTGISSVADDEVQFVIIEGFDYAAVVYKDSELEISPGEAFTLSELKNKMLAVKVFTSQVDAELPILRDRMKLYGVIRGRFRSDPAFLLLTYVPDTQSVKIISTKLLVDEGSEARISSDQLFAQTLLHRRFLFNVTQPPKYGTLKMRQIISSSPSSAGGATGNEDNVTVFTTRDVVDGRLYYKHDGSEHTRDMFAFTITPVLEGELPDTVNSLKNVSAQGSFNISITLLNDNQPVRIVNKPFQIARHSERLLTEHDLWYHDPDIDQDDLALKYVRRGRMNGAILNATSKRQEEIFEFTQKDIASNGVLLRHKKLDFGRFVFWVKDGKHFTSGLFVIRASDPFVRITNSSKLLVEKHTTAALTSTNIQTDTNIVGLRSRIYYRITDPPKHGKVVLSNDTRTAISKFTQRDIDEGAIAYSHDGSPVTLDRFGYSVQVGERTTSGNLSVQVYLASQHQPPVIKRNKAVTVEQFASTVIDRSELFAMHQDVRSRNIIYTIRTRPKYGYLLLNCSEDVQDHKNKPQHVANASVFTQWDINQGHLTYRQTANLTFDVIEPRDNYTFDVSNGILSLTGVVGNVEIIPLIIPLRASNFTVKEGLTKVLVKKYLHIASLHFDDQDIDVIVIEQPINGKLESSREPGKRLGKFSFRLVKAEFVYYVHDGSDTTHDMFRLQARSRSSSKISDVVTTYVTVLPENDQPPTVVNNTGLSVWINSITTITSNQLAAVDLDSPPSDLSYNILPPRNGHVAIRSDPSKSISNFTQHHINTGNLLFVHKGASTGGFTFQVNDHLYYDVKHIFVITAKLLVITVEHTSPLQVFPSTTSIITRDNLLSVTNDPASGAQLRDINYVITSKPMYGRIMEKSSNHSITSDNMNLSSPTYTEIDSFTQSSVDAGLVLYQQVAEVPNWHSTDLMCLKAISFPAEEVGNITLSMNVTYDAYKLAGKESPIRVNRGASVLEGGFFNLTLHQLDASNLFKRINDVTERRRYDLRYRLISLPDHGRLSTLHRILSINDSFLHKFIEQGTIKYTHDDSEEPTDKFKLEAYLQNRRNSRQSPSIKLLASFHITVQPVNDNPPRLLTKPPQLHTVQGFVSYINRSNLLATDIDNPPNYVTFNIIKNPTFGELRLLDQNSTSESRRTTTFTQDDIDQERVLFVQHKPGHAQPFPAGNTITLDTFYFSLTDGKHRPSFSVFTIKINPVAVLLTTEPISMKQGQISALLSSDVIKMYTNGNPLLLNCYVIIPPAAGYLLRDDETVRNFSYDDIQASRITYVMSDLHYESDHMTLMIMYNDSRSTGLPNTTSQLNITVLPLIKTGNLNLSSGGSTPLSTDVLDAGELASLTGSLPIYEVVEPAVYADVLIKSNTTADHSLVRRSIQSKTFTHDDVTSSRVSLSVGFVNMTNVSEISDHLTYRLTVKDKSVQPAIGVLPFKIVPQKTNNNQSRDVTMVTPTTSVIEEDTTKGTEASAVHSVTTGDLSSTTSLPPTSSSTTSPVPRDLVEDDNSVEEMETSDSPFSWLIPLIVSLCLLFLIIIIVFVVCLCQRRKEKQGPAIVRGEESAILRPSVTAPMVSSSPQQATIDACTVVKVSSRSDALDQSQRCPTVPVTVTPLRKFSSDDLEDEETDDGYYGDNFVSRSMPHEENHAASGFQAMSIARVLPSHRFRDLPPEASHSSDFPGTQRLPLLNAHPDVVEYFSSEESLGFDEGSAPRHQIDSDGSVNDHTETKPRPFGTNQYWV